MTNDFPQTQRMRDQEINSSIVTFSKKPFESILSISLLRISGALHPGIFDQPEKNEFSAGSKRVVAQIVFYASTSSA